MIRSSQLPIEGGYVRTTSGKIGANGAETFTVEANTVSYCAHSVPFAAQAAVILLLRTVIPVPMTTEDDGVISISMLLTHRQSDDETSTNSNSSLHAK